MKNILKSILSRLGLVLASVVIVFFVAEFIFRLFFHYVQSPPVKNEPVKAYSHELVTNLKLRYKPTPNASNFAEGVMNTFNSGGFRDYEYLVEKPKDKTRILFLGDSVVYGFAIKMEEAIPKQLENQFKKNNLPVEVLNFGVSGYESEQQIEFLKEVGLAYKPDLVLIGYTLNDCNYASFELDWFHAKLNASLVQVNSNPYRMFLQFLYNHSKLIGFLNIKFQIQKKYPLLRPYSEPDLYDFITDRYRKHKDAPDSEYMKLKDQIIAEAKRLGTSEHSLDYILKSFSFKTETDWANPHWNLTKNAYQELSDLSKKEGFSVVVVIFPFLQEMDKYPLTPLHRFLEKEFKEMGFPVIDMMDWGKEIYMRYGRPAVSFDALHFSALSASFAGEFLYERLKSVYPELGKTR